ncbi:bifunctional 5,10-methylene-tetrahydrofolate dehydrogenase/5,10-methylene-tetrahydrofolate cyclohydrolase [Hymenobacter sp. J193]|uniref:bifunctional 5,10-methylenetetrahydrofolate dehydrogenase/5,10-methenyltetrahydrofolate cyclohydrolase n=1 Tax=Hymenobacter sp. J193 TaxID=2898429 RepID=UPI002150C074|nr:tetrahydrofolate dehydrogenase/cyclohydrolase catalytic domain-containing protein [Hymenobacter sp. J193]MCR5886216.1 bifunctional 5,10-methylene-tetrahydrofolate dehydrogenase/5,10-methylene-tetrahydrofolate cyclohydrolase [Hymenobacter sp. J193]MCR5890243.1 bifunctional 5,10-methylene-tetrahydrofolate dehydrogenase/5,10-methylene-tetrahydrofolate cyclohydrolase [Hymenobacter sp. J193]
MTTAPDAPTYRLIDGKQTAEAIKEEIAAEVAQRRAAGQKVPHLAAVLVGHDGGSETYVRNKVLACERVGFESTLLRYEDTMTEAELLAKVAELNEDDNIDGFIVQLPLPRHISSEKVIEAIRPEKDVDGFHPMNIGRMVAGLPALLPATPSGIVELLRRYKLPTDGKHCVVIGRSNIVGTPVSILLAKNLEPGNCTVTLCHSRTQNLAEITRTADILVAALGRPEFVTADMVKPGAVVIDVGTTRVEDASRKAGWALKGDVKFDEVAPLTSYITPVPGGVGPMTIAMLLLNTLRAAKGEVYAR